jgi:hypothetical protein
MSKFALTEITTVKGKQKFYKLIKDGTCEFDKFEEEAVKNYPKELNSLYHRMDEISRGELLPETQKRKIKGKIKSISEYEVKTKNLRVYYFIEKNTGNIVIIGGYKKNQIKDISRSEIIIKSYLENREANK